MVGNALKLSFATVVMTLIFQLALPFTPFVQDQLKYVPTQARTDSAQSSASIGASSDHNKYISAWNDQYETKFITSPSYQSNQNYTWETADETTHDSEVAYYESFDYEIGKYSNDFLIEAGIKQMIFVDDLRLRDGRSVLGFADVLTGTIFFDLEASRANTGLIQSTIHHEVAHIALYNFGGVNSYELPGWPVSDDSGFVSDYAGTSAAEDAAEVYAFIMTDMYRAELPVLMASDPLVERKVQIVLGVLAAGSTSFISPI